jgi:hypothetical protein
MTMPDAEQVYEVSEILPARLLAQGNGDQRAWIEQRIIAQLAPHPGVMVRVAVAPFHGNEVLCIRKYSAALAARLIAKHPDVFSPWPQKNGA